MGFFRRTPANPEVTFDGLHLADSNGHALAWADLRTVRMRVIDASPVADDVRWVFQDGSNEVVVGHRSISGLLLNATQDLPGFDHEAADRAMRAGAGSEIVCWARPQSIN